MSKESVVYVPKQALIYDNQEILINRGPKNPVEDIPTAQVMALREQTIRDERDEALKLAESTPGGAERLSNSRMRIRATTDLDEQLHKSSESVRAGVVSAAITKGDLALAQTLYNYDRYALVQPSEADPATAAETPQAPTNNPQ